METIRGFWQSLTIGSVLAFIISSVVTFSLIKLIGWFVSGPSVHPESPIKSTETNAVVQPPNYKGVKVYDKQEVFNIKDNAYRFPEAEGICKKYNARLASKEELEQAQKDGANWCNLGWLTGQEAFYPTQQEQVDAAQKWPKEFQSGCGHVGLNGGFYPAQLKLSVNCYGIKPMDLHSVNPWNTVKQSWSKYS